MDITIGSTLVWAWPIILAAIALPLVSIITQSHWTAQAKKVTVVVVAVILALIYAIASGLIEEVPESWSAIVTRALVIAAIIIVITQAVYGFLKNPLTKLEAATTLTPAPTVDDGQDETTEGTAGLPDTTTADATPSTEDA